MAKYNPDFTEMYQKKINYTNPKYQEEFIQNIAKLIREKITTEKKECGYFAIMCDEARCFKEKQLSLCVHYLKNSKIQECFLKFINCSGETKQNNFPL